MDWALVHRQPTGERRLGEGFVKQGGSYPDGDGSTVVDEFDVQKGEIVALVIAAHDRQHACDTTICDLTITEIEGQGRTWKAAEQLQNRIHLNNPLADTSGNLSVWHFYTLSDTNETMAVSIVSRSSLLGRWIDMLHAKNDPQSLSDLAAAIQRLLLSDDSAAGDVDKKLRDDLVSPSGPLFAGVTLDAPLDEKAKAGIASLTAESNAARAVAAKPLPLLPADSQQRQQKSLQQIVWAMLMSSEFRFNH